MVLENHMQWQYNFISLSSSYPTLLKVNFIKGGVYINDVYDNNMIINDQF